MEALTPAIGIGLVLFLAWVVSAAYLRFRRRREDRLRSAGLHEAADAQAAKHARLVRWHQRIVGLGIVFFGIYLATLTETKTHWLPNVLGNTGGGAAKGAGVGFLTYLVVGTVGVVTGGVGVALGASAMALIGGTVGAVAGLKLFNTTEHSMVSPWFSGLVIVLGIYLLIGIDIKRKLRRKQP